MWLLMPPRWRWLWPEDVCTSQERLDEISSSPALKDEPIRLWWSVVKVQAHSDITVAVTQQFTGWFWHNFTQMSTRIKLWRHHNLYPKGQRSTFLWCHNDLQKKTGLASVPCRSSEPATWTGAHMQQYSPKPVNTHSPVTLLELLLEQNK